MWRIILNARQILEFYDLTEFRPVTTRVKISSNFRKSGQVRFRVQNKPKPTGPNAANLGSPKYYVHKQIMIFWGHLVGL